MNIVEEKENAEKERKMQEFVENYKPGYIDLEVFEDAKMHPGRFVFSKMDIMQELGWKNGTFYNRFNQLDLFLLDKGFSDLYTRKKEAGDKVEKLIFSYYAFCEFLKQYYKLDMKWGKLIKQKESVKGSVNNSQSSVKNESTTSQFDASTNKNQDADEKINLYKELIKQKDAMIQSLQDQVEDLTKIIQVKEQKDLEIARIEAIKQQKQILINDAEGNKRESIFSRIFNRRNKKADAGE